MNTTSKREAAGKDIGLPAQSIASCGDLTCESLVDPIPRPKAKPFTVRITPAKREVVLIDNRKVNSMEILRRTQAILRSRGIDVKEEIVRKPAADQMVQGELLARLA